MLTRFRNIWKSRTSLPGVVLILSFALGSCQSEVLPSPNLVATAQITRSPSSEVLPSATSEQAEKVSVQFRVTLPEPLTAGDIVYLVLVDELTGLPYNQRKLVMQAETDRTLSYNFQSPRGSMVKYRYVRQTGAEFLVESLASRQIRYRTAWAGSDLILEDRVFCWQGGDCSGDVGRIAGFVSDEQGNPFEGVMVFAGGAQTISAADGSYVLDDVPVGLQNLTAYAADGTTLVFQQNALVGPGSLTPADIPLQSLPLVEVVFLVTVPVETPQNAVVRLLGNLTIFGNTFADLRGGVSLSAAALPVLSRLEDGRYFYRAYLPAGAEIRYRYTLGDGLWNSEHASDGSFTERRLVVPAYNLILEDRVTTWRYGDAASLDVYVQVPAIIPPNETISLQLDPGLGWMEPLAMWPAGENLWHLTLYSPLVGINQIRYRYCRNFQCDSGLEVLDAPRILVPNSSPQVIKDEVTEWLWWHGPGDPAVVPSVDLQPRTDQFIAGIGWTSVGYQKPWVNGFSSAAIETAALNAKWVLLQPTWSVQGGGSPQLNYNLASDFNGDILNTAVEQVRAQGLQVMLFPGVNFSQDADQWWQESPRTFSWWLSWFESYRRFMLSSAVQAEHQGASALVLGGEWISPSFSHAVLPDGSPSGSPGDANDRWQGIIAEIRERYHGRLLWVIEYSGQPITLPAMVNEVDGLLILWKAGLSGFPSYDAASMGAIAGALLDADIRDVRATVNKPIILGLSFPSSRGSSTGCVRIDIQDECVLPNELSAAAGRITSVVVDLQEQLAIYNAMFSAIAEREWIDGVFSLDFYPALPVQDRSSSIYSKPASGVVWYWYGELLGK